MTVTILVPVYGVERYIAECAESLFGQTYKDIEYVFCDDCTPDKSIDVLKEVVERYPERKEHVRIIRNEHNMGIGGTRAHLLSEVKSDCFCFADSDDILPENAIESLVKRMQETDVDIVDGAYQEFGNGDMGKSIMPCHDSLVKYRRKVQVGNLVRHQVWGRLYKSEVMERVPDLFEEGIDMAEDYCAMTRLVAVTTRAWTDEVVYLYRVEQQSFYSKELPRRGILSRLRATKKVLSFYHMQGHLPLSVEVGILDVYRIPHLTSSITIAETDEAIQYVPEHTTARILYGLLHSEVFPYRVSDALYRFIRLLSV